jgi:hypothetical protein
MSAANMAKIGEAKAKLKAQAKLAREKSRALVGILMQTPVGIYAAKVFSAWLDHLFPYLEALAAIWAMPETQATVKLVGLQLGSMLVGIMLVFFGANFNYLVSAYTAFMNVGYAPIASSYCILLKEFSTAHMLWAHTHETDGAMTKTKREKAHQRRQRFEDSVKACDPKKFTVAIGGFFTGYVNVVASLSASSPLGYVNKGVSMGSLLATPLQYELEAAVEEDRPYRERAYSKVKKRVPALSRMLSTGGDGDNDDGIEDDDMPELRARSYSERKNSQDFESKWGDAEREWAQEIFLYVCVLLCTVLSIYCGKTIGVINTSLVGATRFTHGLESVLVDLNLASSWNLDKDHDGQLDEDCKLGSRVFTQISWSLAVVGFFAQWSYDYEFANAGPFASLVAPLQWLSEWLHVIFG